MRDSTLIVLPFSKQLVKDMLLSPTLLTIGCFFPMNTLSFGEIVHSEIFGKLYTASQDNAHELIIALPEMLPKVRPGLSCIAVSSVTCHLWSAREFPICLAGVQLLPTTYQVLLLPICRKSTSA